MHIIATKGDQWLASSISTAEEGYVPSTYLEEWPCDILDFEE